MPARTRNGVGRVVARVTNGTCAYDDFDFKTHFEVLREEGKQIAYLTRLPHWEELCDAMDSDAENDNYHGMVGFSATICVFMQKAGISRPKIDAVMLALYKTGGMIR